MPRSQDLDRVKQAITTTGDEANSVLFQWLTGDPGESTDYVEVADTLLNLGEKNLGHLVVHRGLALFPESQPLALFALKLELQRVPQAA
jgi:hypothetical protein